MSTTIGTGGGSGGIAASTWPTMSSASAGAQLPTFGDGRRRHEVRDRPDDGVVRNGLADHLQYGVEDRDRSLPDLLVGVAVNQPLQVEMESRCPSACVDEVHPRTVGLFRSHFGDRGRRRRRPQLRGGQPCFNLETSSPLDPHPTAGPTGAEPLGPDRGPKYEQFHLLAKRPRLRGAEDDLSSVMEIHLATAVHRPEVVIGRDEHRAGGYTPGGNVLVLRLVAELGTGFPLAERPHQLDVFQVVAESLQGVPQLPAEVLVEDEPDGAPRRRRGTPSRRGPGRRAGRATRRLPRRSPPRARP